jgi:carboxyl-terminal processing protease
MTTPFRILLAVLAAALLAAPAHSLRAGEKTQLDEAAVALAVSNWLQQAHYSRQELDATMSRKLLNTYLELLDYNKLYLTRQDVEEFTARYGDSLHRLIQAGNLEAAHDIFARYKQRVEDRVEGNKILAGKTYDFKGQREVELNRQKSPWPKDLAEADDLWRARVEAELLQEHLSELKLRTPQETVTKRYDQALRNVREMDRNDVTSTFLKALAQSFDPHSEYMSPSEMENFQISMKLSLVGIGAVLRSEDGYAKIMELVPGGPADLDGRLKVGDRILAVAQAEKEFEDMVDMKLDKVVEKIRGEKGSLVRLQVIPGDADDPSKRQIVEITRDEVKLKDQEAKAELLDVTAPDGKVSRIGWITLPSFYANMSGNGEPKSTTEDVGILLERLKKENIEGLVIDLRRDGGGSLEEAINLTGLFIPRGPVVQAKDPSGKITVNSDKNPSLAYDGPMVVVMNRLSASASEIFAAALQDYGRAVIVGDERSFGKGTVQTVVDLDKTMALPFFNIKPKQSSGALKLTIQKFYRIRGGSTQIKGVESDIVLPSRTDNPEIGEGSLKNPLDYDEVAPVVPPDAARSASLFIEELRSRSQDRISADPEFAYVNEDMQRLRERLRKNSISTNEKTRRQELADDKKRKEARKEERLARGPLVQAKVWQITLDDAKSNRADLEVVAYERERDKKYEDPEETGDDAPEGKKDDKKAPEPDPIRNETVRIIGDLIELDKKARTASAQAAVGRP